MPDVFIKRYIIELEDVRILSSKAILSQIIYLSQKNDCDYCFASITYFSNLLNSNYSTVRRCLNELIDKGYIKKENMRNENGGYKKTKYFLTNKTKKIINETSNECMFKMDTHIEKNRKGASKENEHSSLMDKPTESYTEEETNKIFNELMRQLNNGEL